METVDGQAADEDAKRDGRGLARSAGAFGAQTHERTPKLNRNAAHVEKRERARSYMIGGPVPPSVVVFDPPPHLLPRPPLWVHSALHASPFDARRIGPVDVVAAPSLALLSTSIAGARAMNAAALRAHVAEAYIAVGAALSAIERQPIRFWNFVPSPGDPLGDGLDRYMVFNSGRYRGYTAWLGAAEGFAQTLPTASAIGVLGDDLVISCLASTKGGTPIENPRQTPAWRYIASLRSAAAVLLARDDRDRQRPSAAPCRRDRQHRG